MSITDNNPRRSGRMWGFDLAEAPPGVTPRVPATFNRVGPDSLEALAQAMGAGGRAEAAARLESGRRCYAAWVQDQLAAYGWVSFDQEKIGEQGLTTHLLPGEAYIYDCVTLPAFRQQGLFTALLSHILGELRAEGLRRAWIGADMGNVASHRGIEKAGFRAIADLLDVRLWVLRLMWLEARPGVSAELLAAVRRVLFGQPDRAWLVAWAPRRPSAPP